jgi:chromosomal replication initiation ATPase DnaA
MNAPLHVQYRDECIRLRSEGYTWEEIARNVGIANALVRFAVLDEEAKRRVRARQNELRLAREIRQARHEKHPSRPSAQLIIKVVSEAYGLTPDDIKSKICRTMNCLSNTFPRIGKQFGRRDHSTVRSAVGKIAAMMEADDAFRAKVDSLRDAVLADRNAAG